MHTRSLFVAPLLLAAGFVSHFAQPAQPATPNTDLPQFGPGAVLQVVRDVLTATETGDRAALERAFVALDAQHGVELAADKDDELQLVEKASPIVFQDVGRDGKAVSASTTAEAATVLLQQVAGDGAVISHRITNVRADCPAEFCSWASVEFERTTKRGDVVAVVPMRATVLAAYSRSANGMRVFTWHASSR